jgi:NADPH-dependent 2,4-dienoyl-CoA reductase/sulfur reductase-like enzyme
MPSDDAQFAVGRALITEALRAGAHLVADAAVWTVTPDREVFVTSPGGLSLYRPAALVVATGAYERAVPMPGWTLPGVMTTGAAQSLLRGEGVCAGRRVLVCGNGPLNLQLAAELARSGASVVAVVEQAPFPDPPALSALWRMATSTPSLLAQGAGLRADLLRRRVPVLHGRMLSDIREIPGGLQTSITDAATGDASETFEVDVVCMGYGFEPANEILRALGCRHRFDPARGQLVTDRDRDCMTSVDGVYAAGDCCGMGGARAAIEEGLIAGVAAAARAGHAPVARLADAVAAARRRLVRHRRFQNGLWRLYAASPPRGALATPDTLICRCEGVTSGAITAALEDCEPSIGALKRRTRAGMGGCQGRYCAPTLAALLSRHTGRPIDEMAFFAPRAPVKPVTIAELSRVAAGEP